MLGGKEVREREERLVSHMKKAVAEQHGTARQAGTGEGGGQAWCGLDRAAWLSITSTFCPAVATGAERWTDARRGNSTASVATHHFSTDASKMGNQQKKKGLFNYCNFTATAQLYRQSGEANTHTYVHTQNREIEDTGGPNKEQLCLPQAVSGYWQPARAGAISGQTEKRQRLFHAMFKAGERGQATEYLLLPSTSPCKNNSQSGKTNSARLRAGPAKGRRRGTVQGITDRG